MSDPAPSVPGGSGGPSLVRHAGVYLLARGIPGIIAFLALSLYTRLLDPAGFGRYAMVVAMVELCNAVLFQWLRVGLLRFMPADPEGRRALQGTVAAGYLTLSGVAVLASVPVLLSQRGSDWLPYVGLGLVLLCAQGWYEVNLELARADLEPIRYGAMILLRTALGVAVGAVLAGIGYGAAGVLLGTILGTVAASVLAMRLWRSVRPRLDRVLLRRVARYGAPLTATFALAFLVNASGRLLLGWLDGREAAGLYSVGYDLSNQTISMLMMAVNLAAYPLAVRALRDSGLEAARAQVRHNTTLLAVLGLPAALGLALLASNVAGVFLGEAFRSAAVDTIPWIALAALLSASRSYYADLAFQLGERTSDQVWIMGVAATTNLGLNLYWIPRLGLMGAVYASVAAFAVGLVLSLVRGRSVFPLPFPGAEVARIAVAALGMAAALWPLREMAGVAALALQVGAGAATYGVLLWVVGFGPARRVARSAVGRLRSRSRICGAAPSSHS